jgi:Ni/Fe-hydrogenase subunit HybB-like protein
VVFWYIGLIPDLATLRDRCKPGLKKALYGMFALGWRGANRHWSHYETAYMLLAALSTPLVLSVHSVVSFDFATSVVPGWHTTIFPPYFVAGAIFGGFAMVLTLMIPARKIYGLQDLITPKHIDNMAKIILLTGTIVGYAYCMELFMAYYSASPYEGAAFLLRTGHSESWPYYYAMFFCNVIAPQLFWFRWARHNMISVMIVCMFVNAGMWYERYVIIVTTLEVHMTPGAWRYFDVHRHLRFLHDEFPFVPALPARHRHRRSQGRAAGVQSAPRPARGEGDPGRGPHGLCRPPCGETGSGITFESTLNCEHDAKKSTRIPR